ncbi:MAG TPA: hypothetical protein VMZ04_02975 [Anaerolineae bacterium]|nr:hypothetical protein [Anaerolineae bacterium]
MKDLRKSFEENYLTFIAITTASVVVIAVLIWVVTVCVRKEKKSISKE